MPLPVTSAITTLSGRPRRRKPEEIEEVAADLARGLVVARDFVARDVRGDEGHEAALETPPVGQLLVDPSRVAASRGGAGGSPYRRPPGPRRARRGTPR